MKRHSVVALIVMVLFVTACGGSVPGAGVTTQVPEQSPAQAVQSDASGYDVNVTKNGTELAAYQQVGARGGGATFDGNLIQIILASPDNQHVLTIDIQAAQAGTYPLAPQYEAAKPGQSRLNFLTEAPPALIPAVGEVKLSEFTEQFCSGSFTGTGTDIEGATFSIEGSFSKLVVTKQVSLAPQ